MTKKQLEKENYELKSKIAKMSDSPHDIMITGNIFKNETFKEKDIEVLATVSKALLNITEIFLRVKQVSPPMINITGNKVEQSGGGK